MVLYFISANSWYLEVLYGPKTRRIDITLNLCYDTYIDTILVSSEYPKREGIFGRPEACSAILRGRHKVRAFASSADVPYWIIVAFIFNQWCLWLHTPQSHWEINENELNEILRSSKIVSVFANQQSRTQLFAFNQRYIIPFKVEPLPEVSSDADSMALPSGRNSTANTVPLWPLSRILSLALLSVLELPGDIERCKTNINKGSNEIDGTNSISIQFHSVLFTIWIRDTKNK